MPKRWPGKKKAVVHRASGNYSGLTLLELVATMTIIGTIAALGLPSMSRLAGGWSVRNAQERVGQLATRAAQLAQAPEDTLGRTTIAYGILAFNARDDLSPHNTVDASGNILECNVTLYAGRHRSFVAIVAYDYDAATGSVNSRLLEGSKPCDIRPRDFFVLPESVDIYTPLGQPAAWLLPLVTPSAATRWGATGHKLPTPYPNPLEEGVERLQLYETASPDNCLSINLPTPDGARTFEVINRTGVCR